LIDESEVRRALRRALKPKDLQYNKKAWSKWLCDRLTILVVYSYTDKSYQYPGDCNPKWIECLREFQRSSNYEHIAFKLHLNVSTVQQYISNALTWIIENTPDNLLSNIPMEQTNFRLRGCPKCKGDLFYDDTEDEYWCLACGYRQKNV